MSANSLFSRRNLLWLVLIEIVLFTLANVTAKTSSHPGTVSNIFWGMFLIGLALTVIGAVTTLVLRLRTTR